MSEIFDPRKSFTPEEWQQRLDEVHYFINQYHNPDKVPAILRLEMQTLMRFLIESQAAEP